jgi:hypothetical protein
VPGFLNASTREFVGTVSEPTTELPGFNRRAAEASVRVNGSYLLAANLIKPKWITIAPRPKQPPASGALPWIPDPAVLNGIAENGAERPELRAS